MIVLNNGTISHMSREEFYRLVFNERQLAFIQSLYPDLNNLDEQVISVNYGGRLRGANATHIICDELYAQPEPEKEAVKNKPQIKTNHRTKENKHPLPFYLGSRRRY